MHFTLFTKFSRPLRWLLSSLWLVMLPLLGWGQIATYTPSTSNANPVTGTSNANLTISDLTITGATYSGSSGNYRGTSWDGTVANGATATAVKALNNTVSAGKYITFTLTANTGYTLTISSISFGVGRSGTGPRQFQWRSNADSYAAALAVSTANSNFDNTSGILTTVPDASADYTGNVINLSGTDFTTIPAGTSRTFRFYAYSAEGTGGTGGLSGAVTVAGSVTASSTPTLTSSSLTGFTYVLGAGPSAEQSFTVSGTNLSSTSGNVTASVPAASNYEISAASGSGFTNSAAVAYSSANPTAIGPVYVRLKLGLASGTYTETISLSGGGATASLTASGSVTTPTPTITVMPTGALSFATSTGTPSAEQSYAVSASDLTANLTIMAPSGYEISLASGTYTGTGANTLTLTPSSGAVTSTTIYVRLTGTTVGTYGTSGTPFNIAHSSTNAATINKPVYGTVTNPIITTTNPSSLSYCATSATTIEVPFTTSGTFASGNVFSVQLSSAGGSFTSPTNLATVSSTATSVTATVPAGTANGTLYKVRVVSSNPAIIGSVNASSLTIIGTQSVLIAPTAAQTISLRSTGSTLTATETPSGSATRQWYYSTTSGSGYTSAISGATSTSYAPKGSDFPGVGTYYVVAVSTFTTCGTSVTSSEVAVTVVDSRLTVTPGSLSGFTAPSGSSSAYQTYALQGYDLISSALVTPPSGYEVAYSAGTTTTAPGSFSTSAVTVTAAVAQAGLTVYVRLAATASGTPSGTVSNASTGATTQNVTVSGTVIALTAAPTSLAALSTPTGTPSATRSYTLSGTNLAGDVTVAASSGFEVATVSTGPFSPTLIITPSSGSVSATVHVRLTGTTANSFSGSVSNTSPGAPTRTVTISGTVTDPALVTYSVAGLTAKVASAPATAKDANIGSADAITRGAGIGTSTGSFSTSTNLFAASNWSLSTLADAQANDKFLAFAVTPTPGYVVTISSIVGNVYRTSNGPSVELFYSLTSDFFNPVSLGVQAPTTTSTGAGVGAAITFPANGALNNITSPVYFRLYGYGATSTSGILYFTNNTTSGAPGLLVSGTIAASSQPVIVTGTANATAVCGGSTLAVSYATGSLAATGSYFVQLSDANGSFTNPLDLATTGSTTTSVTATVPATVASGTTYRVRVANTDGTRGSISTALTVVSNPMAAVAPASPQTLNPGTTGTALTVTETPAGTARQWAYATTSGGSYTPISGATGLTYTPSFPAVGTYYVVAQSTFAACGTVNSNEVVVTVAAPTLTATPNALIGFSTTAGSVSAAQAYVLTGTGVLAPVTVTAPAGYEVSLDGATFAASLPVSAGNANAGQTIYVRLTGSTVGAVGGTISNTVGTVTTNVSVSGTVVVSPGMLLAEDNFDYNGALNANGWQDTGTSVTQPGNITAAMYPQGILATGGTSYQASIVGKGGSMLFRQAAIPSGTTVLYAAALINVTNASTVSGDDFIFAFQTISGGTSARGRVTIARPTSSATNKFVLRLQASNATLSSGNSAQFDLNTPYILVLKAESSTVSTTGADQYSVFLLPATANLSQEPAPLFSVSGASFSTVGAFQIRMSDSNNPNLYLDNFRFATGWGAAVGNVTYSAAASAINAGSYYNLTSGNNGQVTQNGAVTVENQLALATGQLALNGQCLTLAGTLTGTGTLTGSAASNLVVLGTGALGTLNFTAGTQTLNNLTLNRTSSGTATLGSPLTVGGTLALTNGNLITSATNLLTLASAANITGGSATSFVSGPVARPVGTIANASGVYTPYIFPVGKGAAYRPLTLNVNQQGNALTYQAEQFEGNPGQAGTDPAATDGVTLTRVSRVRSFTLTPYSGSIVTQPTSFQGTVTLSFGTDDQVTDPTVPSFVMGKRTDAASPWTNIGGTGSATSGTLTSGTITSFSDFALASTALVTNPNPLPVSLTRFTATRAAAGVQVAWATASEKNSDYFEVQRSLDGSTFTSVAKVAAQGTTTQSHTYASLDGTAPAALLYYRLRQVDLDGTVAYSPVVSVAADGTTSEFTLVPNPAHDRVSFLTALPTAYTVRNTLGQLVRSGTTMAGTNNLPVAELPAGVYFFELHGGAGRVVRKFVKE